MSVIHLRRALSAKPDSEPLPGIEIRALRDERDLDAWLALRRRAFALERPTVGAWGRADFEREFTRRAGWRPEWLWLAESPPDGGGARAVGSVALLLSGREESPRAMVHWLMVDPDSRRRGVARALLTRLHAACWEIGLREVWAETHRGWESAMRFYQRQGYEPASLAAARD